MAHVLGHRCRHAWCCAREQLDLNMLPLVWVAGGPLCQPWCAVDSGHNLSHNALHVTFCELWQSTVQQIGNNAPSRTYHHSSSMGCS